MIGRVSYTDRILDIVSRTTVQSINYSLGAYRAIYFRDKCGCWV